MYYPIGWPNILKLSNDFTNIHQVICNRDKLLFAVLSDECLCIWLCKPCLRIVSHRRSSDNIEDIGINVLVEWRPDSSMLVVATSSGQLLFYSLTMSPEHKGLYEQQDPSNPNLKRESAELFVKEVIPSLVLKHQVETVTVSGGVTSLVCIRDELMVATVRGQILRYRWDGSVNRDYCLDLGRVPFCIDQQVSKAEPITESNIFVCHIEYSPLVGGFAAVLNDGRAAFLTAHSLQFDPNQVQGIWAQGLEDATCAALNHKHRLIAFGRKNSHCVVYCVDEATGALEVSHQVILSSKDFPGAPGAVSCLRWSPDGCAMALAWSTGGISLWSTFGSLLMCSLAWDHGLNSPLSRLKIKSMDWAAEGYQLWMAEGDPDKTSTTSTNNRVLKMEMVKSPLTVNPCMSQHGHVHLQGEDKLLVHPGDSRIKSSKPVPITKSPQIVGNAEFSVPLDTNSFSGSKQWVVVTIPHTYSSTNWPIRYTAVDAEGQNVAIAGRMGFAHYSLLSRRWKLFGNETQEKDFVVTGGILWWRGHIILGCYNLVANRDEIRIYDQEARLDDSFAKVEPAEAQVLLLNCFRDQLVTFCADSHITLYALDINEASGEVDVSKVQVIDISAICVHPACVVSITLTCLRTESCSSSRRHTAESLIVNVSGRLLLVQRVAAQDGNDGTLLCAPTVLASCVESVWMPSRSRKDKLHLTEALWLYCGAHGMRVWLPLFPRDGDKAHTFMSKRIMLPFQLNIYPLAILFEDAILLGAENDTVLYSSDAASHFSLPFCVLQRTSQVYLHQILRQLIRRNLGYHAWEIARSCTSLPYFSHSLELLLHEVLEEEATSKEPIPDALLPSVVEFIHEFPVYLETVVQCARKTEVALWPYLFSAAGKPKELFQQCLNNQQLETAASYLLILQNLEACAVSRQYATLLLDTALQLSKWELAKDLIRFLRAIDPNDVETPRAAIASGVKYGMAQSPPLSPHEEDLSLVLGTMQVARGRSYSTTTTPKVTSPEPALSANNGSPHPRRSDVLVRSNSNIGDNVVIAVRKTSAPSAGSKRDSGAFSTDDFFIDNILQRHACRLLVHKQLKDLGQMAGHLDFHLVAWLRSVRDEAARIDNCITTIQTLHDDFNWPYPSDQWNPNCLPLHSTMRKASGSGSSGRSFPASPSVEDRLKALTLDILKGNPSRIHDPVCRSQTTKPQSWPPLTSSEFSPTTVEAKLQPHAIQEGSSLVSDESSSYLGEEGEAGEDVIHTLCWATSPDTDMAQDAASGRVPSKQEVQLRYLLQLFMEAGCLEWALVLSVILRDAMAVLRTTYAARSAEQPGDAVRRLKSCLEQLMEWSNTECLGYRPFMCAIQSQVSVLNKILLSEFENSSDKNTITSVSPSSSTSTLDKPQCAPVSRDEVSCDVPVTGRLRLVSCSSVGNSSLDSLQEEPSHNSSDTEKSENNVEMQRESSSCIIN